jgi:hypothetical protein
MNEVGLGWVHYDHYAIVESSWLKAGRLKESSRICIRKIAELLKGEASGRPFVLLVLSRSATLASLLSCSDFSFLDG